MLLNIMLLSRGFSPFILNAIFHMAFGLLFALFCYSPLTMVCPGNHQVTIFLSSAWVCMQSMTVCYKNSWLEILSPIKLNIP